MATGSVSAPASNETLSGNLCTARAGMARYSPSAPSAVVPMPFRVRHRWNSSVRQYSHAMQR